MSKYVLVDLRFAANARTSCEFASALSLPGFDAILFVSKNIGISHDALEVAVAMGTDLQP